VKVGDRLLARFSRRTTSGQFIPEIDGLRFVAIVLVVLFHLGGFTLARSPTAQLQSRLDHALARITATGHYGVQLFFIISGFVLALPFAAHHLRERPAPRLRAYFLRRLTRLEPPYIIAMVGIFVLAVAGHYAGGPRVLLPHLLGSLAYLHNLIYGTGSTLNVVAWSLEIEVQFYLLAPALANVFAVRPRWARRAIIVTAIAAVLAAQSLGITSSSRLSLTLLNFLQFFLIGFILADLYLTEWSQPSTIPGMWDAVAMFGCAALLATWVFVPKPTVSFLLLAFIVFCATFRGNLLRRLLSNRWLTTIGGMCYSIYLLHYPFISALGRHTVRIGSSETFTWHFLLQSLLLLPALLLVSTAYFALVERPCMNKDWLHDLLVWSRTMTWRIMPARLSSFWR
jgi:peptidoglycan/LPS O-acetylase OafA/YrhL